ncbi:DMT family transporter [Rugamonas sp. CCM 8940]|uniref:DMT family transporter n=1 Tax=Rugamonas sp. CCM 8940 TaxID=2765359 RepID=UPI0018F3B4F5|nr:DMT family transporter [Rugamonas sp. CCM 8940]MBJ7313716.1 DMT family transporter [Rugamonas sp. CCM 8940]
MTNSNGAAMRSGSATLAYVAAMLMLATLGIFVHELGLDSISCAFFRCLFGALALALFCCWRGLFVRANVSARNMRLAIFSGALMVFNWVSFFEAIGRVGITVATVVFHVQPFFVIAIGALLWRERITAQQFAWIGVGFGGLVLACGAAPGAPLAQHGYAIGIACTLGGALAYAGVTVTTRSMRGMPPHLIALTHCLVGVVALAAFVTLPADGIGPARWGWMAGLGLIPTALAYVLIYGALPAMGLASIAVLTFVYPAAAVGVDFLVYGHRPGRFQIAGMGLIALAGLGINLGWRWRLAPAPPTSSPDERNTA